MSEGFSTAYHVRRSQQSPARVLVGAALIGQNGLGPHPAARQGASRARNCAARSVFSFDGSTAVFFLGRQKENGGGIPQGMPCTLRLVDRPARRGVVTPPYGCNAGGAQQRADVGIGPYGCVTGGTRQPGAASGV